MGTTGYCVSHTARLRRGQSPDDELKPFYRGKRICKVPACSDWVKAKDYCDRHYGTYLRRGDPTIEVPKGVKPKTGPKPKCSVATCTKRSVNYTGMLLCTTHTHRHYSMGDAEAEVKPRLPSRTFRREYHRTPGGTSRLHIIDEASGDRDVVLYDDADHALVSSYNWYVGRDPRYATASVPGQDSEVRLHRVLMGCTPGDGVEVDHRDGDTLHNCRSNLRVTDRRTNGDNLARINSHGTSRFRNVHWNKRRRKWVVEFKIRGQVVFPPDGVFDDELAAARFAWQYRADHGLEPGYWPTDDTTTEEEAS